MSETAIKKNRSRVNTANVNKKPKKAKKKIAINQKELDEIVKKKSLENFWFLKRFYQVCLLMSKTGQDKNSIMAYHKNFVAECPAGEMTKSQFVKLTKV